MSTRARIRIFAYGSNMFTARLRERVPSAVATRIGHLRAQVLKWHKPGRDGSGNCAFESTGRDEDGVWGVIFEIDPAHKPALDRAEGLGHGYVEREVQVLTERGAARVATYAATARDPALKPYDWYKAFVVAGAREHGLPREYVDALAAVPSIPDPDTSRAARNQALLSRGVSARGSTIRARSPMKGARP